MAADNNAFGPRAAASTDYVIQIIIPLRDIEQLRD